MVWDVCKCGEGYERMGEGFRGSFLKTMDVSCISRNDRLWTAEQDGIAGSRKNIRPSVGKVAITFRGSQYPVRPEPGWRALWRWNLLGLVGTGDGGSLNNGVGHILETFSKADTTSVMEAICSAKWLFWEMKCIGPLQVTYLILWPSQLCRWDFKHTVLAVLSTGAILCHLWVQRFVNYCCKVGFVITEQYNFFL